MDKKIRRSFKELKKKADKEEKHLIKEDIQRDRSCDQAKKMAKKR